MDWVKGFIIPLASIVVIGGIITWVSFIAYRGISRVWNQQTKWTLKYTIMRKKLPMTTVKWCLDAIDNGIGYYDAKKLLFVNNGDNMNQVYETLFIYDKMVKELHSKKNIRTQKEVSHGRKYERGNCTIEATELPSTSSKTSSD